jgi:Peptidyl-prolyl cis-trans isomerase (rotamase) - cyclophilin family
VFGKVVNGMDVVDDIAKSPTGNQGMHQDVPKETISIDKGERLSAA